MPRIQTRVKHVTWIVSACLAIVLGLFAYIFMSQTLAFDDYIFFAAIVAVAPPAILSYLDFKWRKAIDEYLPDLFRTIVQAQQTGLTLPQALEEVARRDYGPLTLELRKMTTQISWGLSFEDALLALSKRADTTLTQRSLPMIVEAGRSGGHTERVFEPLGKFIQTTLMLDKERRIQTRPYIAIIYVAFFVFLFTIALLFKSFFVSVEGLPILGLAVMSPLQMERIFFHMTAIQGFFGGLVAGKMSDGTISAGLKHSLIMMLSGYVALRLFL